MKSFLSIRRLMLGLAALFAGMEATGAEPAPSPPPAEVLSQRDAITRALEKNFTLRIQKQEMPAAAGELESARAAFVPNLTAGAEFAHDEQAESILGSNDSADTTTLQAGVSGLLSTGATYSASANLARTSGEFVDGPGTGIGSGFTSYETARGTLGVIEISQPLLRDRSIDSARFDIRQSTLNLRRAELLVRGTALDTVYAVELAYLDLVAAREIVVVRESAQDLAARTLDDTKRRVAIGALPDLEEKDAEAQVAASEADLIAARQSQREAENALLQLISEDFVEARSLGVTPGDELDAAPVVLNYGKSAALALELRPELALAGLTMESNALAVRYEKNQRLPEVNLVGSFGVTGYDDSTSGVFSQWSNADQPYFTGGVTISLPWSNRRARGRIQTAGAQLEQARLAFEQQKESILVGLDTAMENVRSSFERIGATQAAREFAEAALAAEEMKFRAGRSTSFTVLQKQRDVTTARADEIAARADYNQALATLRVREGTTLDAWRIQFTTPGSGRSPGSGGAAGQTPVFGVQSTPSSS